MEPSEAQEKITTEDVGALLCVAGKIIWESGVMLGVLVGEYRDQLQDDEILAALDAEFDIQEDHGRRMLNTELSALLDINEQ